MSGNLTFGALAKICQGEDVADPILQVLGHKPINGSGQERYRLLLSDGHYSNSFSMLATQLNSLIHDNQLEQFTLIKVKKHICNSVPGQSKRVVVILELEIVTPGSQIGSKIGNPQQIGADGKIPSPATNQNTNPNAGAAGLKRPAAATNESDRDQPPVKSTNSQARSVLTPRNQASSNTGAQVTPIASITPYQNKWTIKARVRSKTDIKTWNKSTGSGKLFSMDLFDDSGEIRITAFKDQCDAFYERAVVGKVYYISNCSVKNANKQYSKLNNEYELTFKDNGTFELCEDDTDIPTITYNFVSIIDLRSCDKEHPIDIIGVVKSYGDVANIMTKAGKDLTKREVILVDKSATEVCMTLWGNTAENFEGANNPILAAKNVRVSDFNGVSLSGGDILINPDLDLAHELKGWWDNEGSTQETTSITVAGVRGDGSSAGGNMKMIGEVKQENLGYNSDKGDYYSTIATITFFSKDKALYRACGEMSDGKECNKKVVDQGDGQYRCEKCSKTKSDFKWRIILQLNMADASDNNWATCFQEYAEKILGVTSQDLGDALERDEERYNAIFSEATFKTYSFRMRAKSDNYNDETRVKHSVIGVEEINWSTYCSKLISEIESMGGSVPDSVNKTLYLK